MSYSATGQVPALWDPCGPPRESDRWYQIREMQIALNNVADLMGESKISVDGVIGGNTVKLYMDVFGLSMFQIPSCKNITDKIDSVIAAINQKWARLKAASEPPPQATYAPPGSEPYQRQIALKEQEERAARVLCPPGVPGCEVPLWQSPWVLGGLAIGAAVLFAATRKK